MAFNFDLTMPTTAGETYIGLTFRTAAGVSGTKLGG